MLRLPTKTQEQIASDRAQRPIPSLRKQGQHGENAIREWGICWLVF